MIGAVSIILLIVCKCNSSCVYFDVTMLVVGLLAIKHDVSTACMECCLLYVDPIVLQNDLTKLGKWAKLFLIQAKKL